MLKRWLKPLVRPLPQWSPIAVAPPSRVVTATLRWGNRSEDVTADHTVASLVPLTLATSVDAGRRAVLEYKDSATGETLGTLRLGRMDAIATEGSAITLYHVMAGEHRCLGWPMRWWNAWLQNRSMRKHQAANHLNMDPAAAQQLMIAYLCPRPVILVSVDTPDHHNIFPMDLIGPLNRSGFFSLALRSTNVSQPVMREEGRVALSSVPAAMKPTVYKLSEHHKHPLHDWHTLPFPVRKSQAFGVPAVAEALHIREMRVVHSQEIGSHTFFLGRITSEETLTGGDQLHHTAGFHQAYRRKRGVPFTEV
jgi:flavin reductase (DIM6/NTAB) family NADH-FMN oxidoreductase RutF